MKKHLLLTSLFLLALMPMKADEDCLFAEHVFPGQADDRTELDIKADVQMGTVVETGSYFIDQLQSTDPTVVSVTCKNASCSKILFMALKGGKATVSYRQMGSNGKGDCYSYHSIEYTVTKADPIAQFEVDGKATTEPAYMSLNDRNESFVVGFYMPTPEDHDGTIYTLHKKVPMSEISFQSTNSDVAYIDESGKLQLVAKGKATLTASWPGNESWNEAKAQIDVYVSEPLYLRVAGKRITSYNMDDIMGDGKAVYDSLNHTLTLHGVNWDFEDHNIDAKYGVIEYWGPSDSLIIVLDSINSFTNTTMGINTRVHNIVSDQGDNDVYIRSINGGTLRCLGDDSQIFVDGWLFLEEDAFIQIACNSRWETAVTAVGLGVDNGCRMVISSEGERGVAADIPYLWLDDMVYLQGCNHIGKDVSPTKYGFYNDDAEVAWMVVIMSDKVIGYGDAVVPDETEETVINLSNTETASEEKAEDVAMISLGEDDQYNEEQNRLEISTTLTDKEVEDAINLFGQGAQALKYMLPGSISFFIPAGKGSIQIECQTFLGPLKLKLQGLPAYALSQAVMGWAKVDYDVEVDTYVVIYLNSGAPNPAPAHIAAAYQDEPLSGAGAFIKGIKVTPKTTPTAIGFVEKEFDINCQKLLENDQIVILKNGVKYNVLGTSLK